MTSSDAPRARSASGRSSGTESREDGFLRLFCVWRWRAASVPAATRTVRRRKMSAAISVAWRGHDSVHIRACANGERPFVRESDFVLHGQRAVQNCNRTGATREPCSCPVEMRHPRPMSAARSLPCREASPKPCAAPPCSGGWSDRGSWIGACRIPRTTEGIVERQPASDEAAVDVAGLQRLLEWQAVNSVLSRQVPPSLSSPMTAIVANMPFRCHCRQRSGDARQRARTAGRLAAVLVRILTDCR